MLSSTTRRRPNYLDQIFRMIHLPISAKIPLMLNTTSVPKRLMIIFPVSKLNTKIGKITKMKIFTTTAMTIGMTTTMKVIDNGR